MKTKMYKKWENERVRIANLIARKPEIQKVCCICGKPGKTMHNKRAPYYITFICDECRKNSINLIIAEESRFDLRTKLDKANLCMHTLSDEQVIRLVEGYISVQELIGDYCIKTNISRHQFKQLMDRYNKKYPKRNIYLKVKLHSNNVKSKVMKEKFLTNLQYVN